MKGLFEMRSERGVLSTVFAFGMIVALLTAPAAAQEVPVSLAWFQATAERDSLEIEWSTATEANNVGFNIYAKTAQGWVRLNAEMIPSHIVDSPEPQTYRFQARAVQATAFAIEDVDFRGFSKVRGPFKEGRQYGAPVSLRPTDWASIRADREARALARSERRRSGVLDSKAPLWGDSSGLRAVKRRSFPEVDLLVSEDGIYRVAYEDLRQAGFDFAGAHAKDLALVSRGRPIPVFVGGKSKFGPGSFLEFHGEAVDTLYTTTAPYRLSVDKRKARSMPAAQRKPKAKDSADSFYWESRTVDRNRAYSFATPIEDPWYDTRMLAFAQPGSWSFDLDLDDYAPGAGPASLWVRYYGMSDLAAAPDHHVAIELNGRLLAEDLFDGRFDRVTSVDVPEGLLREGRNTLTLRLPADLGLPFDVVFLDSYGVTYPRRFTARDDRLAFESSAELMRVDGFSSSEVVAYGLGAKGPVRIDRVAVSESGAGWTAEFAGLDSAASYEVSAVSALRRPQMRAANPTRRFDARDRADYVVITHPDFADSLGALTAARQAQGLRVRVVDVEDVYANFSHGIFDPAAIRDFVAFASANWGTRFVLLVGGDTYDYRNHTGAGAISFIPSLYAATGLPDQTASGSVVQHAPVDPLYGDVDGDNAPDVAVGRFPVRTVAELQTIVNKTLQYEAKDYERTAVFSADGFDGQVSFADDSEAFIANLSGDWSVERAYLDTLGVAGARDLLIDSMNQGVALASFIGHTSPTIWSFSRVFQASDAANLQNAGRPLAVLQWGCWSNYHVLPSFDTLGHEFLLQDRGAAVVLGSSTQTQAFSDQALSEYLSPLIARPGMTVGEAVNLAKRQLAAEQPQLLDVILGFTLLGDPALQIQR